MANFRSKKLLRAANDCPACMLCHRFNQGDVVAAHANWSDYGKGMGVKAHDWAVAFLCQQCHARIDSGSADREAKRNEWLTAHINTLTWLFNEGVIKC